MGPPWIAAQLRGRVLLLGSRAPAGMWWRGPCARGGGGGSCIWAASGGPWTPGHLRRATGVFWRNRPWRSCSRLCWCFTARSHPAAIRCNVCWQELARCGETLGVAPELLELENFAVLARYDAEPTPLPAERRLLLVQLEVFFRGGAAASELKPV
jgi:hypothetical protein